MDIATQYLQVLGTIRTCSGLTDAGKHNFEIAQNLLDTIHKQQSEELKEIK